MPKPVNNVDWDSKDLRIVRQNLLNRAYDAWCAGKIEAKTPKDLETYAEAHIDFIYNGSEQKTSIPKPTTTQLVILTKVAGEVGVKVEDVMNFCWKKWEKYPTEDKSIAIVVEEFQKG